MNFLVTGGAGFIGSHLCERLLQNGHAVWALDDLNALFDPGIKRRNMKEIKALGKPFTFIAEDLTDRGCLDQIFDQAVFDRYLTR